MKDNNLPLFCFGTLMDLDLLSCVTKIDVEKLTVRHSVLEGFHQRNVIGEDFPVVLANQCSTTSGVVIEGLDQQAFDRILFYEGDEYYLAPAVVDVDNMKQDACVFLSSGAYHTGDEIWDFQHWQHQEKPKFLTRVESYMQYFGKMTATEADQYW